jgi:ABC-type sugar transport system substrate-binding protein
MINSVIPRLRSHIGAAAIGIFIASGGFIAIADTALAKDIKIEFSSSAVDANWKKMIQSMNDSMADIGKKHDATITLNVSDAGMNVDKQISDIQTATVKKPDVLLIDPVDPAGVLPAAKAAQ